MSKTRPPTPRSVSATRNLILASRSSGFTKPETNVPSQRDGDLVRLAHGLVLGRYVQDPIRVDVESDFNLRQATWRWRDPIEMELPKRIVVLGSSHAPLEDLDENTWLVVSVRHERLSLFVGKVVLRSMSFVIASPAVSKPIDKRVTSKSSRCRTCEDPSPMRMAACTAAPKSSAKGGDDVYLRHDPLNDCT